MSRPPVITISARRGSYAIGAAYRLGGASGTSTACHAPSHPQVVVVDGVPPKNTIFFRRESYAILALYRADGPTGLATCVQVRPFHIQVSKNSEPCA